MPFTPSGSRESNHRQMEERRFRAIETALMRIPSRIPSVASSPSDAVVDTGLTQTAHGFDVGTIIFWDSDLEAYRLAKADDAETCVYDGVVSNVTDANTFDLTYSGIVKDVDAATYDDGTTYYLSEVTAGNSKDVPPAYTFYQVPVYHAFLDGDGSTINLMVFPGRPLGCSHLALVAGDVTNGGGTARIFSTPTVYWDIASTGVQKMTDGTNIITLTPTAGSLTLANGSVSSTFAYNTIALGSQAHPISSIDIYPSLTAHLSLNNAGLLELQDTSSNSVSILPTSIVIGKTVSSVVTQSTLTPGALTVGATPGSPTAHSDLTASLLSMTASSAVVCQFSATLIAMTLSASNSVNLAASQITDTSQSIQFRKISICDPSTGLVKNTWLPCSAPF